MMKVELLTSGPPLDPWDCFSAFVNNSREFQEISDSKFDVQESNGHSLLLNVGGQDAIQLLHENELNVDDILKFQLILSKLEKLYLLRLIHIYERYKLSLDSEIKIHLPCEKSLAIQSNLRDSHVTKESEFLNEQFLENEFEPLSQEGDSFDLPTNPQAAVIHTGDKADADINQKDEIRQKYHKTLGLTEAKRTKDQEADKLNLKSLDRVNCYLNVKKPSIARKSKILLSEDHTSVRRSSRQIRVSSRYADSKEAIQHLLKPGNVTNDGKVILEPSCTCSVCKKDFPDSKTLLSHWKSHQQNKKKKKSVPFWCKVCEHSFAHYSQLKIHFKRHLSDEKYKKPYSSNRLSKKPDLNKKFPANIDPGSDQDVNQREEEKQHDGAGEKELEYEDRKETMFLCSKCNHVCNKKDSKNHETSCENNEIKSDCKPLSNDETSEPHHKPSKHKGLLNSKSTQYNKRSYRNIGKYQCKYCKKYFKYERHLELHITLHTGEKPNICEICGKGFRLRRSLVSHMRCHDESSRIKCEHCPKTFVDKRTLENHKLVHSGVKPYSCGVCGKEFRRVLGLRNHCRLHQKDEAIKCDICDKRFVDKWGMLKHKTIHTGEKPFICSICGKMFRQKKGLMDHMKLHNKESQLKCSLCPRTFVQQRKLELHLKAHRGEKSFICDKCGKGFMNSMNLKVHNRCHTGEKPYHCSFCDRSFNQQGSLIAHERHHKGERPYSCSICTVSFITKSQLTIHTRKHFNDRPYKCDQCDYAAYTGSLLKIHKLKHSTEKPYKCLLCPSAFKRQHHLDVHSRTHLANNDDNGSSIEVKYEVHKCPYCEESFDCEDSLSSHLTTHEIVVVTETATDDIFIDQGPEEVAYNIVLL